MPRNRNRQPGPIKRAVPTQHSAQPVSRNLLLRVQTDQPLTAAAPRRTRVGSHGQPGPWSQSMYLRPTDAAMTPAWSRTKSEA